MNVSNYPKGYIRAYLDARLPSDPDKADEAQRRLELLGRTAYRQFPGILLLPPTFEGRFQMEAGHRYVRIKFRIWPGQGSLLESSVKSAACAMLMELDADYADWMVSIHYRAEPRSVETETGLSHPQVLPAHEADADRVE